MHKFSFFLFLGLLVNLSVSNAKIVESVVAVVEGQMILKSDVSSFQKRLKKKNLINENLISFLNLKPQTRSQKELLDYLIAKKIIITFSKKDLNVSDLEKVIQKELTVLAKQNKMSVKQLEKEIRSRGINLKDYRSFIGEASLIRSALEKNVISQVRPTEEDFVAYLKQNGVGGIKPAFIFDLDQIFIPKSNPNAKNLIKDITAENFKDYFQSASKLKTESLKLGVLKNTDLSSTHAKALANISRNSITKAIEDSTGYRIFYVNQKRGNFNIPNTAKVRSLQQKYYDSKIKSQFETWFKEIKPQFFVKIND